MLNDLPFEWFVLLLRVVFVFLLYFFIFQVMRVITREIRNAAEQSAATRPGPGSLLVDDPGDTALERGFAHELDSVTIIGRGRRATIRVESSFVSNEHVQIAWEDGAWWATDLHSTNGTYVNARRIDGPTRLSTGDRLELGGIAFRLVP